MLNRARPYLNLENLISILDKGDGCDERMVREFEDSFSRIAQNILNIPILTSIVKEDLASIVSFSDKPGG